MLTDRMQESLNGQINEELFSAYLYVAMAAYFEDKDLPGFAHWMEIQIQEELTHAQKFYRYIFDRDGRAELAVIAAPPREWGSPLEAFEAAYKHEQHISSCISDLLHLSREQKDAATENFLQWFVGEQVEEEANAKAIVRQLKLVGDFGPGLIMLDRELAQRVFVPPTTA